MAAREGEGESGESGARKGESGRAAKRTRGYKREHVKCSEYIAIGARTDCVARGHARVGGHLDAAKAPVAAARLVEREEARQHRKEANSAAPHVGGEALVPAALEHLGRAVRLGTADFLERGDVELARLLGAAVLVRQPKVAHFAQVLPVEENVLELKVAMDDAVRVHVLHREHQLEEPRLSLVLLQGALFDHAREELAVLRQVHVDDVRPGVLAQAAQANNVRALAQEAHELDLLLDGVPLHAAEWYQLCRNSLAGRRLNRVHNLTITAAAELRCVQARMRQSVRNKQGLQEI